MEQINVIMDKYHNVCATFIVRDIPDLLSYQRSEQSTIDEKTAYYKEMIYYYKFVKKDITPEDEKILELLELLISDNKELETKNSNNTSNDADNIRFADYSDTDLSFIIYDNLQLYLDMIKDYLQHHNFKSNPKRLLDFFEKYNILTLKKSRYKGIYKTLSKWKNTKECNQKALELKNQNIKKISISIKDKIENQLSKLNL